jgi:hypothetical protein
MAFRLYDWPTVGRTRWSIGAPASIRQAPAPTIHKGMGEGFSATWQARNDGGTPGEARLRLLDEGSQKIATGPTVIVEPGEKVQLTLEHTPPGTPDEVSYQIGIVTGTNRVPGSGWHPFTVSYLRDKQAKREKQAAQEDERIRDERTASEKARQKAQAAAEATPDRGAKTGVWHGGKFYPYSGDPAQTGTMYKPGYGKPPPLPPENRVWRLEIDKFATAPATIDNDKHRLTGRVFDDNGNLMPTIWIKWTATNLSSGWSRQLESAGRHSALMFMGRGSSWRIDANVDYRYGSGRKIYLHDSFTFRVR